MQSFKVPGHFLIDVTQDDDALDDDKFAKLFNEHACQGFLNFDMDNGCVLEIIGNFASEISSKCTIYGTCSGKARVSLYNCTLDPLSQLPHYTRYEEGSASIYTSIFHCEIICDGIWRPKLSHVKLESISLAIQNLETWLGVELKGLNQPDGYTWQYKQPENEFANLKNGIEGVIAIKHGVSSNISHTSGLSISTSSHIEIQFSNPIAIEEAIAWSNRFKSLTTLGLDKATEIIRLTGKPIDTKKDWVELFYTPPKHRIASVEKSSPNPFFRLFSFDDIGGIEGLANLCSSKILDSLIEATLSHYIVNLPSEYSVFSLYKSIAKLASIIPKESKSKCKLCGKKNMRFYTYEEHICHILEPCKNTLIDLAFEDLKQMGKWVNCVVGLRDNILAHTDGDKEYSGQSLSLAKILSENRKLLLLILSEYIIHTATTDLKFEAKREKKKFSNNYLPEDIETLIDETNALIDSIKQKKDDQPSIQNRSNT